MTLVKQIVYYNDSDTIVMNKPVGITKDVLVAGDIFKGLSFNEIRLQAFPGAVFVINGEEVMIGPAGEWNISKEDGATIASLEMNERTMRLIDENPSLNLTITILKSE